MQLHIPPARRAPRTLPRLTLLLALVPALVVAAALALCSPATARADGLADHTVQGISPRSTTINLFDYWIQSRDANDVELDGTVNEGINSGHTLKFGKGMGQEQEPYGADTGNVNKWTMSAHPRTNIVADELGTDGYPVLSDALNGGSLAYLFNPAAQSEGKTSFSDVDGLIQIDSEGYYYFDCHKNYAAFDEATKSFVLYDAHGIKAAGSSGNGQFFPFTSADEVFDVADGKLSVKDVNSLSACAKHYFGLTMSTRFIQQNSGMTADGKHITYNFSGDDDVWIFIDGHLVGDLGGIHDMTSIQIDFATGDVTVFKDKNDNNAYDAGDEKYDDVSTTLQEACDLKTKTFPDNTYHTLDFFYLERGNTDSNLSLRYNLATYPASTIQKIDQDGTGLAGVEFLVTDQNNQTVCTATTDATGAVGLLDEYGEHVSLQALYDDGVTSLTFTEQKTPAGYRSTQSFTMSLKSYMTMNGYPAVVLLADEIWEKGAYAASGVTSTLSSSQKLELEGGQTVSLDSGGTLFMVIEKNLGSEDNPDWQPVYGDPVSGWHLAKGGMTGILEAARATNAVFRLKDSGYEATIDDLPGNVYDYVFFDEAQGDGVTRGDGSLRGGYFYTKASSLAGATAKNTERVTNSKKAFGRVFSAHVYIPNIQNRFIVQKVDDWGRPVEGAKMALYESDQVERGQDGAAQLREGAEPYQTVTTSKLAEAADGIDLEGAGIFSYLEAGEYWLGELSAPAGYAPTDTLVKVLVCPDGVFADAGESNDGVKVTRGIGKLVRSMIQFAANDDIDATLHDLVATPMALGKEGWEPSGAGALHLTYADEGDKDAVLDYVASVEGGHASITVDEGIPGLKVQQCNEVTAPGSVHDEADPRQDIRGTDVTALFGGTTVVQLENKRESLTVTKVLENAGVEGAPDADTKYKVQLALTFADGATAPSSVLVLASVQNADGTGGALLL